MAEIVVREFVAESESDDLVEQIVRERKPRRAESGRERKNAERQRRARSLALSQMREDRAGVQVVRVRAVEVVVRLRLRDRIDGVEQPLRGRDEGAALVVATGERVHV